MIPTAETALSSAERKPRASGDDPGLVDIVSSVWS